MQSLSNQVTSSSASLSELPEKEPKLPMILSENSNDHHEEPQTQTPPSSVMFSLKHYVCSSPILLSAHLYVQR